MASSDLFYYNNDKCVVLVCTVDKTISYIKDVILKSIIENLDMKQESCLFVESLFPPQGFLR